MESPRVQPAGIEAMVADLPLTQRWLSYNEQLDRRDLDDIELVVIHATELPDLAMAREYGERVHYPDSGTGNSGHFYIDRDGTIEQWVALDRIAHHVADRNANSIGIELVNTGRYPDWFDSRHQDWPEAASEDQILALIQLLNRLTDTLPSLEIHRRPRSTRPAPDPRQRDDPNILVQRKLDPGPRLFYPPSTGFLSTTPASTGWSRSGRHRLGGVNTDPLVANCLL